MEYITIANYGNATDFGDMGSIQYWGAGCCSPTRGIISGGSYNGSLSTASTTISYITIASAGNSSGFGSLTPEALMNHTGASNNTRGLFFGGRNNGYSNGLADISYITIASTGNTSDFGDCSGITDFNASTSSSTRAVVALGQGDKNTLEYVTISSTGNTTDFGDLTAVFSGGVGASQVHGGLS